MVKIRLDNGKEIYLDGFLVNALDTLIYNAKNDWDFVIVITGDRMVRTGKSVLGMSICAYLAKRLNTPYTIGNVFFDSQDMINSAQEMPKHSIIHYDEGREGLAASKSSQQLQKDLLDYFAECGQLNHIFVIVLPDFFELKEQMAVARSECLINVYRKTRHLEKDIYNDGIKRPVIQFDRGYFEFFNRGKKQLLYDKAKSTRRKNYGLVKANFLGRFTNNYPIDEEAYRKKKSESLARFEDKKKIINELKVTNLKKNIVWKCHEEGKSTAEIVTELELVKLPLSKRRILEIIKEIKDAKILES